MALIDGYNEPRNPNPNCLPGVQEYLAHLESTVRGKPGFPVEDPEPFMPVEAGELIDGPVVAPVPPRPPRRPKRRPVPEASTYVDRDAINLKKYARKLKGQE